MTDELQVARLSTSIAESLSPVPAIHGAYYGALSQLYPLLLAPFYGTLSAPEAETAAHGLNAILLASAAWPAFLLARSVAGSRGAGYVAAALVVFTPWLALASTMLTENAAYPAFVWSVYLCQRALASPSRGRDAAALAGLMLAFFARTQLFVLALALPAALVLHEIGFELSRRSGPRRNALRTGASRLVAQHTVLAGAYSAGAAGAAALALTGRLGSAVGNYAIPFRGDLLPPGFWGAAAAHIDQVAVGAGILPLALAVSWTLTTVVRPEQKESHAFAALLLVLVPLLTFEATSFDLRFTPDQFIQDRYLCYVVPLLAVGSAAWLTQRTRRTLRITSLVAAGAAIAALLGFAVYDDGTIIFWASPAAAFHPALETAAGALGLSGEELLRLGALALALALAGAVWVVPRVATVVTALALAGFGAFEAAYVLDRYADPVMRRPSASVIPDWIDRAVPAGTSVALVPSPRDAPAPWWEAELWNKDVDRLVQVGWGPTFSPFPADRVAIDRVAGTLRGPLPSDYLVLSPNEVRFHLSGAIQVADGGPLELVRVRRPYRLSWWTLGVTPDGWTRPNRPSVFRLYGRGRSLRRTLVLTLAAPPSAAAPVGFVLRAGSEVVRGAVDPGGARPPVGVTVCVPADGYADATLVTSGKARLDDGRHVGLHLDQLHVYDNGPCTAR